jgi:hypothetical protein
LIPSPASIGIEKSQVLLAGEGSIEERGLRPLSNAFPFSKRVEIEHQKQACLRRG